MNTLFNFLLISVFSININCAEIFLNELENNTIINVQFVHGNGDKFRSKNLRINCSKNILVKDLIDFSVKIMKKNLPNYFQMANAYLIYCDCEFFKKGNYHDCLNMQVKYLKNKFIQVGLYT